MDSDMSAPNVSFIQHSPEQCLFFHTQSCRSAQAAWAGHLELCRGVSQIGAEIHLWILFSLPLLSSHIFGLWSDRSLRSLVLNSLENIGCCRGWLRDCCGLRDSLQEMRQVNLTAGLITRWILVCSLICQLHDYRLQEVSNLKPHVPLLQKTWWLYSYMFLPEDHAGNFAADLAQMVGSPEKNPSWQSCIFRVAMMIYHRSKSWFVRDQLGSDFFCASHLKTTRTTWLETSAIKVVRAKALSLFLNVDFLSLLSRSIEKTLEVIKRLFVTLQE